ncbi:MAG: AMP-binding protein [Myxococcales bacterium]|nr:AMP-binding protein [Myxococcales bacterium]
MGVNVAQMLRQGALRFPERVAVVEITDAASGASCTHTYGELDGAACRVAARLQAMGVLPGEPVALMAGNSAAFVSTWFGAVYAGAALVPIPILSAAPEVTHRVVHSGARVLIVDRERRAIAETAMEQAPTPVPVCDLEGLQTLGDGPSPAAEPLDRGSEDTALILYTSATTGAAKGAAISHAALMLHTAVMAHHTLRLTSEDVVMGVLPLSHSYGCRMVMLASFFAGARCVLLARFRAEESLAVMEAQGATWLPAVPTMFAAWANVGGGDRSVAVGCRASPGRLRWAMSAGAPLSEATARRAEACLGTEVRQGYGMTEATIVSVNGPPDTRVFGSVGQPVWGIEVAIVDGDDQRLPAGHDGQVLVRGHNMMSHYIADRDATAAALDNGWMRTGDVGHVDANGRLFVVDRIKDLIIRGGHNVYPSEVEEVLATHPAVAEVAVVGRPDDYYGEEIVAVVVPRAAVTAAELCGWAAERVARTKLPREVALVGKMPVGPSGKVLKRSLRAQLEAGTLVTERA